MNWAIVRDCLKSNWRIAECTKKHAIKFSKIIYWSIFYNYLNYYNRCKVIQDLGLIETYAGQMSASITAILFYCKMCIAIVWFVIWVWRMRHDNWRPNGYGIHISGYKYCSRIMHLVQLLQTQLQQCSWL